MRSQCEANNTFLEKASEISTAFQRLERDAKELWQMIDECAPSLVIREIQETDEALESNRNVQRSAQDVFGSLQAFSKFWTRRTRDFSKTLNEFRFHIDRAANKRALDRLPAELLQKILTYPPIRLKTALAISHVCRRFRGIVIDTTEVWSQIRLSSEWGIEQNLAIAERGGFRSSRACIILRSSGHDALQLLESAKAILDTGTHLEELEIWELTRDSAHELQWYFGGSCMTALHSLTIFQAHIFEPSGSSSIQFPGFCKIPTLRFLQTNFVLDMSLAENLVGCRIWVSYKTISRSGNLGEFLSFAHCLRDLELRMSHSDMLGNLEPMSLPNLRSLTFSFDASDCFLDAHIFMENIVPFTVRKLTVNMYFSMDHGSTVDVGGFFSFIERNPSIRDLVLRLPDRQNIYLRGFGSILDHIEVLSLNHRVGDLFSSWAVNPGAFRAYQLRQIGFTSCHNMRHSFILSLRDFFKRAGHHSINFLFRGCRNFQDGTYRLDDVESAVVTNRA